ncbi:MAG: hypothetical protein IIA72_08620 [Proteobacteria bacterium]|nr:hypothetical protein [Pseudomonadota bacterium]
MKLLTGKLPEQLRRGPGRPKGLGRVKGSGRKKGVPNRGTVETREFIQKEADPIAFLCRVSRGLQFEASIIPGGTEKSKMYPTLDQRLHAAQTLARKVLPDMKAIEMTGEAGAAISVRINLGAPA